MPNKPNRRSFLKILGIGAVVAPTVAAQIAKASTIKFGSLINEEGVVVVPGEPPPVIGSGALDDVTMAQRNRAIGYQAMTHSTGMGPVPGYLPSDPQGYRATHFRKFNETDAELRKRILSDLEE